MKSIAIVTDSNCGMSPAQVKDLGIYMLPMPFFIDDKEYLEDIDMNQSEFFQHLEQNPGCRVSTSQPTPESVTTLWDKLLKDYDEIVHIPMSSGLSSSMQTARMLAEDYDGRVRVVNNQRISGTLRYSAIEAIQQAKNGLSREYPGRCEVIVPLGMSQGICHVATVDNRSNTSQLSATSSHVLLAVNEELRLALEVSDQLRDRKSTRLNSSHIPLSRMPSSA